MSSGAGSGAGGATVGGVDVDALFAAVAAHAHLDLASLNRTGLQGELSLLGQATSWISARRAQIARALLVLAEPGTSPEHDVATASKSSLSRANDEMKRAATLGEVPEIEDALAAGSVSTDHVDRLTNALDRLGERRDELAADGEGLAALAASTTPEQFGRRLNERIARLDEGEACDRLERQKRANRFRTWTDQITGMLRMSGDLDPETGLAFIAALEAAVEAMFHGGVPPECPDGESRQDWLRAMALVRLVTGAGVAAADGDVGDIVTVGDTTDLVIVIDLETMLSGLRERSIIDPGHDLTLPVESYRRMACTACIIPAVMNSDGVILDQGRQRRLATKDQRRALRAMYETCAIPGCRVRSRHCEPHHVSWWTKHIGPTNLANLLPVCSRHHHAVHEGGWHLVLHPDRSLTHHPPRRDHPDHRTTRPTTGRLMRSMRWRTLRRTHEMRRINDDIAAGRHQPSPPPPGTNHGRRATRWPDGLHRQHRRRRRSALVAVHTGAGATLAGVNWNVIARRFQKLIIPIAATT